MPTTPVTSSPAASGTIRRIMSISIHLDDVGVIDGTRHNSGRNALKSTEPDFLVRSRAARLCYEVFIVWMPHSVLARPRQRPARSSSPSAVRLVQGIHPTDRKPGRHQRMTRQFGADENRLEFLARDIGEGIELQPRAVVLDHRNVGARIALEALAAVEPGRERLQRTRQRLDLADTAAGVGIGEPEVAVGILARQRLLGRLDRADVLQARASRSACRDRPASPRTASRCRGRSPGSPDRHRP